MSGMQLYLKFMFTLSVGLIGVGLVIKTLLETIFREWDAVRDLQRGFNSLFHHRPSADPVRAEDILLELERGRRELRYERQPYRAVGSLDRRREALRELREAEERLASPHTPEVV